MYSSCTVPSNNSGPAGCVGLKSTQFNEASDDWFLRRPSVLSVDERAGFRRSTAASQGADEAGRGSLETSIIFLSDFTFVGFVFDANQFCRLYFAR
jgi:hypothetical protein